MEALGKYLMGLGACLALLGAALLWSPKIRYLGRLPGDIRWARDGFFVFLPLTTCLILSILLSLFISLIRK